MKNILFLCVFSFISAAVTAQTTYSYNEIHKISEGGTLHLSSNDADVTILGTNRSDVSVEILRKAKGNIAKNQKFYFDVEEQGGDLYVTEVREGNNTTFIGYLNIQKYTIKIHLPHKVKLDIEGDDDDYDITGINGDIKMETEDGEIVIYDCASPRLNIKADDANIALANLNTEFKTRFEDGEINIHNCELPLLDLVMDDGDLNFKNGHSVDTKIKTADGDIYLNEVKGDLELVLDDGDAYINELWSQNVDIKGYDGNVEIGVHLNADSNYKIKMDDGDIDINLLSGGGKIEIRCDDGNINARSNAYDYITDEDHYKLLETKIIGTARMDIRIEDGDVRLTQ
ncbi:MAG: DUF4097 domain-containing protein [Bacteroidia bacterium]|nr:DUF4097 domain-containing protein [Bacteroidia bacterium]